MNEPPRITQVASDVVGGLRQQPMLLTLVVLNVVGLGTAAWFLRALIDLSDRRMEMILKSCLPYLGVSP